MRFCEGHHVLLLIISDGIVRHVIVFLILSHDVQNEPPKFARSGVGAAFLLQQGQADPPFLLRPAMLAGEFIDTAFEGLPQAEVAAVQRQDFLRPDRIEYPIRQLDLDFLHSTLTGLPDNFRALDQTEGSEDLFAAGHDVRVDPRPGKTLQGGFQLGIAGPGCVAVRGNKHVERTKPNELRNLFSFVQSRH